MVEDVGRMMRVHLEEVEEHNGEVLDRVAERMHRTVAADGLILSAGTGHSRGMVLETFYRAGGLACVRPIVHPAFDPFAGGATSTLGERMEGLGRLLVEAAVPSERDTCFVFSNSGVNPVPVEIAATAAAAGATVVAVTSVRHMAEAPRRAGDTLGDLADHVLDTRTPPGDAAWPTPDGPTAPLSSLSGSYLWNLLLVRLAAIAAKAGTSLPLWTSANVEGGDERNRRLFERYRVRIPEL